MAYITNQATLSYNGNVTNSNITTGEPVAVLFRMQRKDEGFQAA